MTIESRSPRGPGLDRAATIDGPRPDGPRPDDGRRRPDLARQSHPGNRRAGRIPGLDGLRALAVVAVIAYHLFPAALPGGFLGVDVFFVVSGFLITTLLLREVRDGGRLQLARFWVRRARRLVPALVVVLVVSIPAAALADRDLLVGIGRQVLGALTFSTNWLAIGAGSSYFDATQPELFQTFWSLAIEEQFYLVWPLLLAVVLAVCRTWRVRARLALAGALASALLMALRYHPGDDPTRAYYGTDTHAFGLLLGAAVAFVWAGRDELVPRRAWARWMGPAALVVLGAFVLTMSAEGTLAYRGGIFAASLLALVAVAACTGPVGGYVRALELRPLVWVGERSYGLYLWHWPVILVVGAFAGVSVGQAGWWRVAGLSLAITVLLSWASYRWVETPVRRMGARECWLRVSRAVRVGGPRPRVAVGVVAVLVLGTAVAIVGAPAQSQAQTAVEAAQREIDAHNAAAPKPGPTSTPTSQASSGPTAASTAGTSPLPVSDGAGEDWTVEADQVVAFGDSVLSAAAPTLYDRFPGIRIDAKPIRKWIDAAPIVEKAAADGTLRPVVVLNFGTNGGFQFKGSKQAVEDVLDAIGPDRRVVVVTINGISHWVPDANAELEKLVADRPNVTVADWNGYVHDHPGLLHSDRTHPNMAGVQEYAAVLRDILTADG